jgi:hypothetical protein
MIWQSELTMLLGNPFVRVKIVSKLGFSGTFLHDHLRIATSLFVFDHASLSSEEVPCETSFILR